MSAYNHYPIIKYADEPKHVQQHMEKILPERESDTGYEAREESKVIGLRYEPYVNTIGMTKEQMKNHGVVPGGWQDGENEHDEWIEHSAREPRMWNEKDYDDSDTEDEELPVDDGVKYDGGSRIIKRVIVTTITTTELWLEGGRITKEGAVRNKIIHNQEIKKTKETESVV